MGRFRKRKLIYFGVDYIKRFVSINPENDLLKLSVNSNQQFLKYGDYTFAITKISVTSKYKFLYSISYDSISLGFCGFGGDTNKDFIEITGQGLTLFGSELFYFLMNYLELEFVKFKRVDICFDLELDLNYFNANILSDKFKTEQANYSQISTKRNGLETIYLGKKNIKENSYILNRIYNKIIDSNKKEKLFLYSEYKNEDGTFKNITRFETELREDLCKFYPFQCLKDSKFLYYRLVKSFFKYNPQYFKYLKDTDFFEYQKKYNLKNKINLSNILAGQAGKPNTAYQDRVKKTMEAKERRDKYGQEFIDEKARDNAIKMFTSLAKKLFGNGFSKKELHGIIEGLTNF